MTDPVLQVDDLSKTFRPHFWSRTVDAVREVAFEVHEEEVFGIVGPNGAGKTTTIEMMMNLVFPDRGEVRLFGEPASRAETRSRLGYLPEQPNFYDHLSATELLEYYGALHGLDRSRLAERIPELLELVGLEDVPDRPIGEFSKGMRQRAGMAQALVNDPELVVLDEPQSGLDPMGRKEVRDLIFELRSRGKTVLFSSHILVDVEAVCDRVALLHEGRLVEIVDIDELSAAGGEVEVTVDGLGPGELESTGLDALRHRDSSGDTMLLTFEESADLNDNLTRLIEAGGRIVSVERRQRRLEEQFLRDISGGPDAADDGEGES